MIRACLGLLLCCACGPSRPAMESDGGPLDANIRDGGVSTDAGTFDGGRDPLVLMRPFDVTIPVGYRLDQPVPLVVLLHGYTMTARAQDAYFRVSRLAQQRRFLVALPDGLPDSSNFQYWNATDACCAFGKTTDDVAYLGAVIRDVQARYAVDPKRIFIVGFSNGGFMAHRLGCDLADLVAGFVSVAGSTWADASKCNPSQRVAALQLHGTIDSIIPYDGGTTFGPAFPSAETSVRTWASKNACTSTMLTPLPGDLDLDTALPGTETERAAFLGCADNGAAELWTIRGATHQLTLDETFAERVYTWLMAHPKP
jgi:polyhydroxybutyrate depolymerase